ncbi:MAG: RluA family pseudouridine synthase [Chitinophagales bacterium]|nr:RluA family pseudouridine synthase [Chitinophagales bacterium]
MIEEEDDIISEAKESSDDFVEEVVLTVDKGQSQLRIDKFLHNYLGSNISRTKIQNAAAAGSIAVNGQPVKPSYKVRPGDVLKLLIPRHAENYDLLPENIPLDIVYEDDTLIVLNKEPMMVVHPGLGNPKGTLINALLWHFKDLPSGSDVQRPGLVHRIDKGTSGLLVIAKTEYALAHLAKQFFNKTTQRKYLALVWGDVKENEGTIIGNIGRHSKERRQFEVFPDGDFGKPAVTHYKVVERLNYVTLVECRLETGRTHQIRVHMKYIGHTLFNDERYGGNRILKGTIYSKYKQFVENCFEAMQRQALHAATLGFVHPVTKKEMFFESPLPTDFETVLQKWRRYWTNPNASDSE